MKTLDDGKIPVLTERLHDIPLTEWTWEDFEEERQDRFDFRKGHTYFRSLTAQRCAQRQEGESWECFDGNAKNLSG